MLRAAPLVILLLLAGACSDTGSEVRLPTQPGTLAPSPPPAPPPPPPPSVTRDIALGEAVEGIITNSLVSYEFLLTVPSNGTLTVRLTWDVWTNGTLLKLKLESSEFPPTPPEWSPVVGRMPVVAGQKYRLTVSLAGSDWIPNDSFTLTTEIE